MTKLDSGTDDDLTIVELVVKVRKFSLAVWENRATVLLVTTLAGVIGLTLALGSAEEYEANMRVLPYRSGGASGSLSGLAGLAGVRLPNGTTDQTITTDLYPVVATSLNFRIAVAETPLYFRSVGRKVSAVEYFREIRRPVLTEQIAWNTIRIPGRLLSFLSPSITGPAATVPSRDSSTTLVTYDRKYLGIVTELGRRVVVTADKKTGVITIVGTLPDPYAAADLVRVTSGRLMETIIEYETRKAGEQYRFLREQYGQAKVRAEEAQRELAIFADRNRTLLSAVSRINEEQLKREYDIAFEVYQQFNRDMEQARVKMNLDTPVFTVLDQVTVPISRISPNRARILMMSLVAGALAGIGLVGLRQLVAGDAFAAALQRSTTTTPVTRHEQT